MIMADKIITLRKKNGWSQEEFAELLGVSRQSVSKWEGAQSIPDMNKILAMSKIFGVSTDYLLKDELEIPETQEAAVIPESYTAPRTVSLEEASDFLTKAAQESGKRALAVALCILSPVVLIVLASLVGQTARIPLSEEAAVGIGLITLMILVSIGVAMLIASSSRLHEYAFLEDEPIETAYGVSGMVKERREQFRDRYTQMRIIGVILCILACLPIFVMMVFFKDSSAMVGVAVGFLLIMVAVGVSFLIRANTVWDSYNKLLEEDDYTRDSKAHSKSLMRIAVLFWLVAVAIFLGYSFWTDDWGRSWIIWPVAGVTFAVVMIVANMVQDRKKQ